MAKSTYTESIANEICDRIAAGESLRSITNDKKMPAEKTVYVWLRDHPDLQQKYARAREAQMEKFLEEILEISDNCTDDVMFLVGEDKDGSGAKATIKHSAIQRARLQVDSRKWAMSKLAPKKYGDKIQQEVSNKDGEVFKVDAATRQLEAQREADEMLRIMAERCGST